MPLFELYDSRKQTVGTDNALTLHYCYFGSEDDAVMRAAVEDPEDGLLIVVSGLVFQNYDAEHKGAGVWDIFAYYGTATGGTTPTEEHEPIRQSFSTVGGTQHITQSLGTIQQKAKPGEKIADHQGAINYDGEKVNGTDIPAPVYEWTETHRLPNSTVNFAYRRTLYFLSGRMNNATFRGFATGEVLFFGAEGSPYDANQWELTFKFAASPNVSNLSAGDISGIDKLGWDYLWFEYGKDEKGGRLVKIPIQANVERVLYSGDLSQLQIGTGEI